MPNVRNNLAIPLPRGARITNKTSETQTVNFRVDVPAGAVADIVNDLQKPKRKPAASLGSFVMLSRVELYNLAISWPHKGATPFLVLFYISSQMGYNNTYTVALSTLSKHIGRSEREIQRSLNRLVDAKLFRKLREGGSGKFTYFLNPNALARGREDWIREVQDAWWSEVPPPPSDRDSARSLAPNPDQARRGLQSPRARKKKSGLELLK